MLKINDMGMMPNTSQSIHNTGRNATQPLVKEYITTKHKKPAPPAVLKGRTGSDS